MVVAALWLLVRSIVLADSSRRSKCKTVVVVVVLVVVVAVV